MIVSELTLVYLLHEIMLSGEQAIGVWNYHLRKHAYAQKAQDEDILKTKCLGQSHVDAINLSAFEWLTVNDPGHAWVNKYLTTPNEL